MKNKIKLINVLVILLLISFVRADTNVTVGIITNENINFNANLTAGGNVDLTIDGVGYRSSLSSLHNHISSANAQTVTTLRDDISDSSMDMNSIYYRISELFIKFNPMKNIWGIVDPNKLDTKQEQRLRWVFDNYFVPRSEVNEMINHYDNRITDLELRVLALEKVAGDENVLKGRLNVANGLGIDLTYDNTTYYFTGHSFVSLRTVEQPVEEPEITEFSEGPDPQEELLIAKWQDLCDRGIEKFCLILEQREQREQKESA